jgi:hypothetical protein
MVTNIILGGQARPQPNPSPASECSPGLAEMPTTEPPPARFHPLVPAIGFVLLTGMAWLYATGSDLYNRILAPICHCKFDVTHDQVPSRITL